MIGRRAEVTSSKASLLLLRRRASETRCLIGMSRAVISGNLGKRTERPRQDFRRIPGCMASADEAFRRSTLFDPRFKRRNQIALRVAIKAVVAVSKTVRADPS